MTNIPDDPIPDPDDPMLPWLPVMEDLTPKIDSALRKIGLYIMDAGLAQNPRGAHSLDAVPPVLIVNFTLGDIAFSDRVQNPIEGRMDAEFKAIENQMSKQTFEDLRAKMEQAVKEGRNPLEADNEAQEGEEDGQE